MRQKGYRRVLTHIKDPFYRAVLKALQEVAPDPDVFEACMADLLRSDFPGLVPVPGGKDQGRDGEAFGNGRPIVLICTTGEDVARNLRKNLDTLLQGDSPPRRILLATSRAITSEYRRQLLKIAADKGFQLLPVFERQALADRLYRNNRWCQELLGLTGAPSALSIVPLNRRPLIDLVPIGRELDIDWLRSGSGDRVLFGAPGSGKTFLLHHLMRAGWNALFLVSEDQQAIAKAIREQEPGTIVVDDAHGDPARITLLKRLRQELGTHFSILTTCWEGGKRCVQERQQVSEGACRKLELLTRDQIVEVFRALGVQIRDDVLRELVDQAANKPGLAATIATLWLQGAWEEILDGTAVMNHLIATFGGLVGEEAEEVLAVFALGGVRGMTMRAVGNFLRLDLPRIRRLTTGLAAGGVLAEVAVDTVDALAVQPRRLRTALLQSTFFSGSAHDLDFKGLFKSATDRSSAVEALAVARLCGSTVPDEELRILVSGAGTEVAWEALASSSEDNARWVLDNYRGPTITILSSTLSVLPHAAVQEMLRRAGAGSLSHHGRDQVMRMLALWAKDIRAEPMEAIARRSCLARAAKEYLLAGGNRGVGLAAMLIAIAPDRKGTTSDPGRGDTLTMHWALLPGEQLRLISQIWAEIGEVITDLDQDTWTRLSSALWNWIYPEYAARGSVDDERRAIMHEFAGQALRDLVPKAAGSPGLAAGLHDLAARVGIDLPLDHDAAFELLYPVHSEDADHHAIAALAADWAKRLPEDVAEQLAFYQAEAGKIGHQWSPAAPQLCQLIADSVEAPELWLHALRDRRVNPVLIGPFLKEVIASERPGWQQELESSLTGHDLRWEATSLLLQMPVPPEHILARVLEKQRIVPTLAETLSLRKEVPLPTLRALLHHPDWEVALAAAIGEWYGSGLQGQVRFEVLADWKSAVVRAAAASDSHYRFWLGRILASDAALAFDWLAARLREPFCWADSSSDSPAALALRTLSPDQRRAILGRLEPQARSEEPSMLEYLVARLIGRDKTLYGELLKKEALERFHDAPLSGPPDENWEALAVMALDAGIGAERVAEASLRHGSLLGPRGDEMQSWLDAFARLARHSRPDVRRVGQRGQELLQGEIDFFQQRRKQLELYGLE